MCTASLCDFIYWNIELNISWISQGLRRSLVSAELISQATVNFFDDLHQRASEVMKLLDKSNISTADQLQKFEKEFKVKETEVTQLCSTNN